MTIKEIEKRSGMTRANVRFYESEGLLNPARTPNGYRDYSEEDLAVLERILLLRTLHLPLSDIKALSKGEMELSEALEAHLKSLKLEQKDAERSQTVCRVMQKEEAQFDTLDAKHYLEVLTTPEQSEEDGPLVEHWTARALETDVPETHCIPWQRYFARTLDLTLYGALIWLVLILGFHVNPALHGGLNSLILFAALLVMIVLEPTFLHFFRTTPGKWMFGIRITDREDRNLTFDEALERTFSVLWHGMALRIPLLDLWREYKSYQVYTSGELLPWEEKTVLTVKDEQPWRFLLLVPAAACCIGLIFFSVRFAALPAFRGPLTVEQFCANYNQMNKFYYNERLTPLAEDGTWYTSESNTVILFGEPETSPEFITENGILRSIRWERRYDYLSPNKTLEDLSDFQALLTLTAMKSQRECGFFEEPEDEALRMGTAVLSSCSLDNYGIKAEYTVDAPMDLIEQDWWGIHSTASTSEQRPYFYSTFTLTFPVE